MDYSNNNNNNGNSNYVYKANYGSASSNAAEDNYVPVEMFAADEPAAVRTTFIMRTYFHLIGAIAAFVALEALLLQVFPAEVIMNTLATKPWVWLVVLFGMTCVGYLANLWAFNARSLAMQYAGLGLYIVAEAAIFLPIIFIAQNFFPGVIASAGWTTLALFTLLSVTVFVTRHDFSFLRSVLVFGFLASLGLIVVACIFGYELGLFFTYVMIALACMDILYETSNVMLYYRTTQYVGAALALFAAVALLFWYILWLFMQSQRN